MAHAPWQRFGCTWELTRPALLSRAAVLNLHIDAAAPCRGSRGFANVHTPRCGWLLPLCALCSWLCCSAICQNAASVSQNFIARTDPLQLAFGALIVCATNKGRVSDAAACLCCFCSGYINGV